MKSSTAASSPSRPGPCRVPSRSTRPRPFGCEPADDIVTLAAPVSGAGQVTIGAPGAAASGAVAGHKREQLRGRNDDRGQRYGRGRRGREPRLRRRNARRGGRHPALRRRRLPTETIDFASHNGLIELPEIGATAAQSVALGGEGQLTFEVGDDSADARRRRRRRRHAVRRRACTAPTAPRYILAAQTTGVATGASLLSAIDLADLLPAAPEAPATRSFSPAAPATSSSPRAPISTARPRSPSSTLPAPAPSPISRSPTGSRSASTSPTVLTAGSRSAPARR